MLFAQPSKYRFLALAILLLILCMAFLKFSIAADPNNYCAFGPFAKNCHNHVSFEDLYQTLRGISRVLPFSATILFILLAFVLMVAISRKDTETQIVRKLIFIKHSSLPNLLLAKRHILHWLTLHEGGSPAAFL